MLFDAILALCRAGSKLEDYFSHLSVGYLRARCRVIGSKDHRKSVQ
jgi:hypothetical protein